MTGWIFIALGLLVVAMSGRGGAWNERWVASNRFARRTTLLRGRALRVAGTMMFVVAGAAFVLVGVAVLADGG